MLRMRMRKEMEKVLKTSKKRKNKLKMCIFKVNGVRKLVLIILLLIFKVDLLYKVKLKLLISRWIHIKTVKQHQQNVSIE